METVALVDYGMGNLASVGKALELAGARVAVTGDPGEVSAASRVVLPGVGDFTQAMENLRARGLVERLLEAIEAGRPFLGICLGLQLLFEESEERGPVGGLGVLKGRVRRFGPGLKVPHMGWNEAQFRQPGCPLFRGLGEQVAAYFAHSYYVEPAGSDVVAATTGYGSEFVSAIARGRLFGTQFHPEKSGRVGLAILENFLGC